MEVKKIVYNLLIVDDEQIVVNGLAEDIDWQELEIEQVLRATNGLQALKLLENNKIDVVIADIRMPEMDGLELVKQVCEKWPMAKVILLSGYERFEYAQKPISFEVFRYLTKPIASEVIKQVVQDALQEFKKT